MTQANVSGPDMNLKSARSRRCTSERNVQDVRLKNDADIREIYEFEKKLGQGSFGVVYEATHIETQTKWAIKKFGRPAAGSLKVEMVDNEINLLKQMNHPHIIHLEAVYRSTTMIYLVTELCKGGDLRKLWQQKKFFTEDETRDIICSLADAVVYLHKRALQFLAYKFKKRNQNINMKVLSDIVHRDLKLENILVKNSPNEDDGKIDIKVADFGLSVKTRGAGIENIMTHACGTLIYMAPEMMSGRGYTQWCDVWSIGVVMYMLLCGEPPYFSKTKGNMLKKIMNSEVKFTQPIWASVSDAAKNLMTCLLKVDPAYRMSANQLLENPWITGDTNVPVVPSNVLEMMRQYLEQEETNKTSEVSPFTSFEENLESFPVHQAPSAETDSNCRSQTRLSPERHSSSNKPSTSTKLDYGIKTKESGGSLQQDKQINSSDTPGQSASTQLSVKQRRPQEKKDLSAGQKQNFKPK